MFLVNDVCLKRTRWISDVRLLAKHSEGFSYCMRNFSCLETRNYRTIEAWAIFILGFHRHTQSIINQSIWEFTGRKINILPIFSKVCEVRPGSHPLYLKVYLNLEIIACNHSYTDTVWENSHTDVGILGFVITKKGRAKVVFEDGYFRNYLFKNVSDTACEVV